MEDTIAGAGIISAIIGIVIIIVFFVLVYRVEQIKVSLEKLNQRNSSQPFYDAQIAGILGKKNEAIEKYIEVLYMINFANHKVLGRNKAASAKLVSDKITKLGGEIPSVLKQ